MRARVALVLLLLLLAPVTTAQQTAAARLDQLVAEYVKRTAPDPLAQGGQPLVPGGLRLLDEATARADAAWFREFRTRLDALDQQALTHDQWVTWAMLRTEAENGAARGAFFWHEVPVAPYSSPLRPIQVTFGTLPVATAENRRNYIDRLRQMPSLLDRMQAKLQGQVERGIILPRGELDLVVPFVRSFAAPPEQSGFAVSGPRLETMPAAERDAFARTVRTTIGEAINPAFERLASYIDGPYRAKAGDDVGVRRYPSGLEYYRFLIQLHTGLALTPEEIHQVGLDEVARLERELDAIRAEVKFGGTLAEFRTFLKTDARFFPKTPDDIGEKLMEAAARIEPKVSDWFSERPKAPYGARRLPLALEPSMTYGYYQVPTTADPKGYYLYNGSHLDQRSILNVAALSFHELVPGHHFQIALSRESTTLIPFRRNAGYTAFIEGWAEYASDIAGEMGMYPDPYDRAGRISMDLFLSTRLVVDTGMNALGWSRERAMQFMRDHTFESEAQIGTETLRYSSDLPGQALAYKLGSHTIHRLRARMKERLGDAFDIRRFHQAVIGYGAMPLNVLERHVERMLIAQ